LVIGNLPVNGLKIYAALLLYIDSAIRQDRLGTADESWHALGLVLGFLLVLAQLQEGPPPSLAAVLLIMVILISVELAATLLGFALLGGYLGLRPKFSDQQKLSKEAAPPSR